VESHDKKRKATCSAALQVSIANAGAFMREMRGNKPLTCSRAAVETLDGKGYCRQHAKMIRPQQP
jgi:hypothetical protein